MGISASGPAAAGGSPNLQVGALLFEWNGLDLTEFEAACRGYEVQGGTAAPDADSTCIPTVVADPLAYIGGNLLRLTFTSMEGCAFFAVLTSVLTLPSRYVVDVFLREETGTFGPFGAMVYANDDGVDSMQGLQVEATFGNSSRASRVVVDDVTLVGTELIQASGNFLATNRDAGGVRMITTVDRKPSGEATALSILQHVDQCRRGNAGPYKDDTTIPHLIAGVSTNWDNIDMDRFGLFVEQSTNGNSGVADFKHLRVYAHPDD